MERSLRQEEIDALMGSARARSVAGHPDPALRVQPYHYSRAGQISSEQLRAISLLNDLFARNLTHNLGAWLRSECKVQLVSAEQIPYNEFMMRVPELAFIGSVRLDPLGALSVLQMELAPIPSMIDSLLGGAGLPGEVRELTAIEEAIVGHVVEIICRELSAAWQAVGLSFHFESRQMQTQMARLMPVTERTLCLSFELRLPQTSGLLNFAFPAVVSNTILRRLTGEWKRQSRHSSDAAERMRARLMTAPIGAALQLPKVRIGMAAVERLERGEILTLPMAASTRPRLQVAGVSVFTAAPVRAGEHRAAHLLALEERTEA
jgi:flagellar motor switch protein FliM